MKLSKKIFLFFAIILCMGNSHAQKVTLSEENLSEIAKKSPFVSIQNAEVQKTQLDTGSFRRSFYPKIEGSVGREKFTTDVNVQDVQTWGGAEASITLFNGLRDKLENQININLNKYASKSKFLKEKEVLKDLTQLYWEMVFLKTEKSIRENLILDLKGNESLALKKIKAGLATLSDQDEFNIIISQNQTRLGQIDFEFLNFKNSFNYIAGFNLDQELIVPNTLEHKDHDEIVSKNALANIFKEMNQLNSQISQFEQSLANKFWLPKLELYGGYNLFTQRERDNYLWKNRDDTFIGVRLTWNIFDGGTSYNNSLKQDISNTYNQQNLNLSLQGLELEKRKIENNIQRIHTSLHQIEERFKMATNLRIRISNEYKKGLKSSLDLLTITQRRFDAQIEFISMNRDLQKEKANLKYFNEENRNE